MWHYNKANKLLTLNYNGCYIRYLGSSYTKAPPSLSKTSVPVIYLAGWTTRSLETLSLLCLDLTQHGEVQRFSRKAAAALNFPFLCPPLTLFSDISFIREIMEFVEFLLTPLHDLRANHFPQWGESPLPVTLVFTMPGLKIFHKVSSYFAASFVWTHAKPPASVKLQDLFIKQLVIANPN